MTETCTTRTAGIDGWMTTTIPSSLPYLSLEMPTPKTLAIRHLWMKAKACIYYSRSDQFDTFRPHLRPRRQTSPTLYLDFGEYVCAL